MQRLGLMVCLVSSAACVFPRSAVLGMTAAPLGAGNAEVGVSPGVSIATDNQPPSTAGTSSTQTSVSSIGFPSAEGNAQIGLTDWLGLNFHLSSAGLQPGLKFNLLSGNFALALMPEGGIGYAVGSTSSTVTTGAQSTTTNGNGTNYLSAIVGAKLLFSHSIGVYGGAGFDYQIINSGTNDPKGVSVSSTTYNEPVVNLALGWSFKAGAISIRPELAVIIAPANQVTSTQGTTSTTLSGGSSLMFYPNITLAAASGKAEGSPKPPEPLKPEELELPPLMRAP